jgi:hypothetical protein
MAKGEKTKCGARARAAMLTCRCGVRWVLCRQPVDRSEMRLTMRGMAPTVPNGMRKAVSANCVME